MDNRYHIHSSTKQMYSITTGTFLHKTILRHLLVQVYLEIEIERKFIQIISLNKVEP